MKNILLFTSLFVSLSILAQDKPVVLEKDIQIKMALQFLTEEEQDHAKVLGYNKDLELVVLKESDGYLTCIADDPSNKGFEVVCYHNKLDDFMQRGRELRAEGKGKESVKIREQEIEAGTLKFPKDGQSILYVFTGLKNNLDVSTGILKDGHLRYVVYTPYATQETTGLPTKPTQPGMPWLMNAGSYRSHIMITPIK